MERVWDELRKIEKEAELLEEEAVKKSKAISEVANREAEKIIFNSRIYADAEVNGLRDASVKEIAEKKETMLKENSGNVSRLSALAEENKKKAVNFVFDQVLGNNSS
jgi:F0F1-type ATP synthase membrane subunit b/b'